MNKIQLKNEIVNSLKGQKEIERIIIFGSFNKSESPNDLDIAIVQNSSENRHGQIMITMVDTPAGFDQVNIAVTRVEVHKVGADASSGWVVINNNAATYDLLTLRNGASVVLGNSSLDAGLGIRFFFN